MQEVQASQSWSSISPAGAPAVGIVAHRESLYYWDTEGKLFKRDINQTKWEQLEGSVRQASVGASGLWAIGKSTGQPYHWNAATEEWERVDAPQLTQLSIAAEQHDVVAVDGASGSLYRWDGMAWNKLPGQASCITVDDQGGVWAATSQGRIYFLASKSFVWRPVEGSASVIAAAGRHVVSLTKDGTSQLWNGMCWDPLGQERLQHIAVNSQGAIWGVDIHGGIRKLELGRSPVPKTLESCCKVALRSAHGKFLCAETNGHVVSNRDAAGPWETWFFQPTATNEGSFRSHHGKYLCAERNHSVVANRERADIWEKWKVQHLEGNRYAFRSHHGKLLCAERNHSVIANRDKVGPWETWELTFLDL